jgi:hypothetical protein
MDDQSQHNDSRKPSDSTVRSRLLPPLESKRVSDGKKDDRPINPEAGCIALIATLAVTFGLCYVFEKLLGQWGALPALLSALLLGREAKRFARYLSEKFQ